MSESEDLAEDITIRVSDSDSTDWGRAHDSSIPTGTTGEDVAALPPIVWPAGTNIDSNYEVGEIIGSGGMGSVYHGKDVLLGRAVAIKVMNSHQSSEHVIRFQREAQILGRLNHPHVASIYQLNLADDGRPYIVMEYVDGEPLSNIIASQSPLNPYWIARTFKQICDGLKAAHDSGITHRDLKPANILITKDSNGIDTAKIIDFGIAKDYGQGQDLTKSGDCLGSPFYMSPEQCSGEKIDYRSDIYSAGCVLFELLTGGRPFQGKSALETISMHVSQAVPALPKTLKSFDQVVGKMLAKNPEERYQSIALADLDLQTATIAWGQFKYSVLSMASLSQQRQLPAGKSFPITITLGLLALSVVFSITAVFLHNPVKNAAIFAALTFIALALIKFLQMLYEPIQTLKAKERELALGPAKHNK